MLLRALALADIDVDPYHPLRTAIAAVQDEYPGIDPPNLASGPNDAIIHAVLVRPLAECLASQLLQSHAILGVHAELPFAARNLGGPDGEAVNGGVAIGDFQDRKSTRLNSSH